MFQILFIKKENDSSLQRKYYHMVKKQLFTDLQTIKCYSLWSKLSVKGSESSTVNHDMQKLSFKIIYKKELSRKETYDINIWLHFCLISFNGTQIHLKISQNMFMYF